MSISISETETVKAERSVPEPEPVRQQPENKDAAREEKAQPVTERQETGTHEPEQAPTVQLTLFDLWEYTEEERNQALSGKKKKSAAKSKDKNGKKQAQVTPKVTDEPAAAPAVSPQKETEDEKTEDVRAEDAEAKETAAQAHPDDIYADIDWEENPPINGFYETMMHLTPEVRIQLRHEAEKHRQELLAKSGMKDTLDPAFVPSSDSRPVQQADMTHGSEQVPEDESPLPEDWDKFTAAAQTDKDGNRLNPIRVDGQEQTDEKSIGKRLQEIVKNATTGGQYKRVGELYGFPIKVVSERTLKEGLEFIDNRFVIEGNYKYSYNNGHLAMADTHVAATNFLNALERIPGIIDQYKEKIATLEREIPQLQEIAGKTWKKEDELKQLKSELAALDRKIQLELAPPTPESTEVNRQGSEKKQTEQQQESPHADFVRSHLVIGRPGLTEPKGMKL